MAPGTLNDVMVPPTLTNPWWIPLGRQRKRAGKVAGIVYTMHKVLVEPGTSYSVKVPPDRKKP